MRVFLDANVVFTAAHNPEGKAALLIELGGRGLWEVCSSRLAVEEARRNLARKFPQRLDGLSTLLGVFDSSIIEPISISPRASHARTGPSFRRRSRAELPIC